MANENKTGTTPDTLLPPFEPKNTCFSPQPLRETLRLMMKVDPHGLKTNLASSQPHGQHMGPELGAPTADESETLPRDEIVVKRPLYLHSCLRPSEAAMDRCLVECAPEQQDPPNKSSTVPNVPVLPLPEPTSIPPATPEPGDTSVFTLKPARPKSQPAKTPNRRKFDDLGDNLSDDMNDPSFVDSPNSNKSSDADLVRRFGPSYTKRLRSSSIKTSPPGHTSPANTKLRWIIKSPSSELLPPGWTWPNTITKRDLIPVMNLANVVYLRILSNLDEEEKRKFMYLLQLAINSSTPALSAVSNHQILKEYKADHSFLRIIWLYMIYGKAKAENSLKLQQLFENDYPGWDPSQDWLPTSKSPATFGKSSVAGHQTMRVPVVEDVPGCGININATHSTTIQQAIQVDEASSRMELQPPGKIGTLPTAIPSEREVIKQAAQKHPTLTKHVPTAVLPLTQDKNKKSKCTQNSAASLYNNNIGVLELKKILEGACNHMMERLTHIESLSETHGKDLKAMTFKMNALVERVDRLEKVALLRSSPLQQREPRCTHGSSNAVSDTASADLCAGRELTGQALKDHVNDRLDGIENNVQGIAARLGDRLNQLERLAASKN